MTDRKTYLGDGVYADLDCYPGSVTLTTEDGISVTNRIVLEPEVLSALLRWSDQVLSDRHREDFEEPGLDEVEL